MVFQLSLRKGNEFLNIEMTRFAPMEESIRDFQLSTPNKHWHGYCLPLTTKSIKIRFFNEGLTNSWLSSHVLSCPLRLLGLNFFSLLLALARNSSSEFIQSFQLTSWSPVCFIWTAVPPDSIWFLGPQLEGVTCKMFPKQLCSFLIWQLFDNLREIFQFISCIAWDVFGPVLKVLLLPFWAFIFAQHHFATFLLYNDSL